MTRNHGASEAAGDWLAFCDDDDLWAPHKLASQLAAAAVTGRTWAYAGAVNIDSALAVRSGAAPPTPEQLVERLPTWNTMPGGSSNAIVRADVFWQVGGWDGRLVNLADWDLWIRLARCGLPASVSEPLVGYRIHPGKASSNRSLILKEARLLTRRYNNRVDYGAIHHYLAWVALRSGQRVPALRDFVLAAVHGQVRAVRDSVRLLVDARLRRLTGRPAAYYHDIDWKRRANLWLTDLQNEADADGI
jgi:glycosyltransferase involved in cell wall biosynthesis